VSRSHWPGDLFDTHCHLHFRDFAHDLCQVVKQARDEGVRGILIPSIDSESSRQSSRIAEEYMLWSAAGFHPNHLENASEETFEEISHLSLLAQAAAVGETGLDYHRDRFPRERQRFWFSRHIELASALGLPLVVHSRDAGNEVLEMLPEEPGFPVVLHSWNGEVETTRRAVDRGYFLGITGALTYRNSILARTLQHVPRKQVLVETDAPFLTPEPHRGRRNQPWLSTVTAGRIAMEWGISVGETFHILWNNALRAFLLSPENRRTHIVYPLGKSLYVNLTGKCNSSCVFCVRKFRDGIGGYHLRHRREPSREAVLSTLGVSGPSRFGEVVFCGYGEPTMRPDLLMEAAEVVAEAGGRTRLNTNGLCLDHLKPEEAEALLSRFNRVSVSLNASGAGEYRRICPNSCRDGWESLMAFIRMLKKLAIPTVLTCVSGSGSDMPKVAALAERLELPLKIRGGE